MRGKTDGDESVGINEEGKPVENGNSSSLNWAFLDINMRPEAFKHL